MRLVITGNIGSGKSTVLRMLGALLPTYKVFSVDDAVRSLYDVPAYRQRLREVFGSDERATLSNIVFTDYAKKLELEALTREFVLPLVEQAFASRDVIVEFPLVYEQPGNWADRADFVLALGCDDATQAERVMARDKMSREKFERVRASQYSTAMKAALADAYIDTGVSFEALAERVASVLPSLHMTELKQRCDAFFGTPEMWPLIEQAYSEPQRAYHTLNHLRELFAALDPYLGTVPNATAIELAVWFHDFVYAVDPALYGKNEALSARAMVQLVTPHIPARVKAEMTAQLMLAAEFIVATKKHRVESHFVRADADARLACEVFLDADLSILAADEARFARYDDEIAREWGQDPAHPSQAFCEGRAKAMASFAERESVFFSPQFASKEAAAKSNLAQLVAHWQGKAAAFA